MMTKEAAYERRLCRQLTSLQREMGRTPKWSPEYREMEVARYTVRTRLEKFQFHCTKREA